MAASKSEPMHWRQLPNGRVTHSLEWVVIVLALAVVPVILIEESSLSSGWKSVATVANWADLDRLRGRAGIRRHGSREEARRPPRPLARHHHRRRELPGLDLPTLADEAGASASPIPSRSPFGARKPRSCRGEASHFSPGIPLCRSRDGGADCRRWIRGIDRRHRNVSQPVARYLVGDRNRYNRWLR